MQNHRSPRAPYGVYLPEPDLQPATIGVLDDPMSLFADEQGAAAPPTPTADREPAALFPDEDTTPRLQPGQAGSLARRPAPAASPQAAPVVSRGSIDNRMLVLAAVIVALAAVGSMRACALAAAAPVAFSR